MWNRLRKIMWINLLCALWNGCHYRISLVEYKVWRPRLWKMCRSTWKNKEHYSRSKYKADKWYDVSWHMQLHMSNDKQWRNTIHYVKPTAQLLFKSQFPKGEHKKRLEMYLPIHDTLIGKLQGMHCQCGIWIHAVLTVMQESQALCALPKLCITAPRKVYFSNGSFDRFEYIWAAFISYPLTAYYLLLQYLSLTTA